jgi:hypothetical protein
MDLEYTKKLDNFIQSGLLGAIPKIVAAFVTKIAKNYVLY